MNGLLCVAAIAASLVAPNLANNCNYTRCMDVRDTHTMCKYPNPNPVPACGAVSSVGFTAAEKQEIIDKHNELRHKVATGRELRGNPGAQPIAVNMNILTWDNELEEIAQRWANQCSLKNDDCRDVVRFAVGQNIGWVESSMKLSTTPSDIIMMWYDEVDNMDRNLVSNLTAIEKVAQYTQIVWAGTGLIGCGKIVYTSGGWNRYYMVCNYGPSGNWMGLPVYLPQF